MIYFSLFVFWVVVTHQLPIIGFMITNHYPQSGYVGKAEWIVAFLSSGIFAISIVRLALTMYY